MKTSELTGALLNYWVARAEGVPAAELYFYKTPYTSELVCAQKVEGRTKIGIGPSRHDVALHYCTDWKDGGPLLEKHYIELDQLDQHGGTWAAYNHSWADGDTPLQAICRAVVRAAFGDEVEEVLP